MSTHIRNIVLGVLRRGGSILCQDGWNPESGAHYVRPPGGGIEFGESGADAIAREMHEELGIRADCRFMGVLDNRWPNRHEIALIYDVLPEDPDFLIQPVKIIDNGVEEATIWIDPHNVPGNRTLVPPGLPELLLRDNARHAYHNATMRSQVTQTAMDPGRLIDGELELTLQHFYNHRIAVVDMRDQQTPAYVFTMAHRRTGQRMGSLSLRLGNTEQICMYVGHIGYGVERPYRGQRLATRAVSLLLPFAKRHGISPVWITCNPDNYASRRTCELAGGELIEIVPVPPTLPMYQQGDRFKCRYRFV